MPAVGFLPGHLDGGGGLERYELAMARGLRDRAWSVHAAYELPGDLEPWWRETAATLHQIEPVDPAPADRAADRAADRDTDRDTDRVVEALRGIDVLYLHSPSTALRGLEIASRLGVPVVAHLHLPPVALRSGWKAKVVGPRRSGFPDEAALATDARVVRLIAVSNHTAALWTRYGVDPRRISVVHNGIDTDVHRPADTGERIGIRRELAISEHTTAVGYVGRIDASKGIEQLLAAFEIVRAGRTDVTLVVVGEATRHLGGSGSQYTAELRRRTGHDVIWLGRRSDPERIYRALDLVVVPSQWPEPFGLVAAEALASGVAVIAADRGGLPEVMGRRFAAQVVEPSAGALARAIGDLIDDPDQLRRLGSAGRAHVVDTFSLDAAVAATEQHLLASMGSP